MPDDTGLVLAHSAHVADDGGEGAFLRRNFRQEFHKLLEIDALRVVGVHDVESLTPFFFRWRVAEVVERFAPFCGPVRRWEQV